MDLMPRLRAGKPGYVVNLPDNYLKPTGKWTSRGLGTRDLEKANAVAKDAGRLLERRDLLTNPLKHLLDLVGYHPDAVALILGKDHPAVCKLNEMMNPHVGLTAADLNEIRTQVADDNQARQADFAVNPDKYADWEHDKDTGYPIANGQAPQSIDPEIVTQVLARFMPSKVRDLNEHLIEVEGENATLKARAEQAERDASELRQDLNRHVTMPLSQAVIDWYNSADFLNLAARTQHEVRRAVDSFVTTLSSDFMLADLQASHILAWRDGLRSDDDEKRPLAARTLIKNTMYLRSFVSAAYVRYDLRANPMDKIRPPSGAASKRENVVAIRSLDAFNEMLNTLQDVHKTYWYPLVATAVLAGPRYAELAWLRVEDVNLSSDYICIGTRRDETGRVQGGTKTGRERLVPIERTKLKSILKTYISKECDGGKSWLFPSYGLEDASKPRTKTPPNLWCDSATFHRAWDNIADFCKAKTEKRDYWGYGPREWRHCAGTAMGHSGNDSARVSSWLGNSESVCRRFYCAAPVSGRRWSFRW